MSNIENIKINKNIITSLATVTWFVSKYKANHISFKFMLCPAEKSVWSYPILEPIFIRLLLA